MIIDDFTFIILIIVQIVTTCLSAYTLFIIIKKIIEIFKVRSGWIVGRWILPNKRELTRYVRPMGDEVKIRVLGKEHHYNYKTELLTFMGNTPVSTWNVGMLLPMDLTKPNIKQEMSSDDISNLIIRAYNLGIIAAMRENRLLMIIALITCACAGGALAFGLLNMNIGTTLTDIVKPMVANVNTILANQPIPLK